MTQLEYMRSPVMGSWQRPSEKKLGKIERGKIKEKDEGEENEEGEKKWKKKGKEVPEKEKNTMRERSKIEMMRKKC